MKFPYGLANFEKIINEEYFYIDRTARIRQIEDIGSTLLFLRPRRFGKSLLLSMLENYYDVKKAPQFQQLFGHLAIGQNPTAKHNQYLILKWNFSTIMTQLTNVELNQTLHDHINGSIEQFKVHYQDLLSHEIILDESNGLRSLQSVLAALINTPYKIYLLIDEYDNFANEVLMARESNSQIRYKSLLQGEGIYKTIFKTIKHGTEGQGIDRVFITGVSPVVMSDLTSGFNIAENIYLLPDFNDLCGFWEAEVAAVLQQVAAECQLSAEQAHEALIMMRTFYNGYSFTYDQKGLIYNPTLTLYFLKHFQKGCGYPRDILDTNLSMDRGKIAYVAALPHGYQVVTQALNETQPLAIAELADRFGVKEMLRESHDATFMVSLLYYFGVLTLTPERTAMGSLILKIPNLVIRKLYVEQIHEQLLPDFTAKETALQVVQQFYQTGDLQPLCDFIEQSHFKVFDNRDYRWTNELVIKTLFLTLLFNDTFYIMDSEMSLQRDYADLVMIVRPDMRQFQLLDFLIEFKYVALGEHKLDGEQVREMSLKELKALKPVKKKIAEAKKKLIGYRQTLESVYGARLRLHTYCVVSVGYDRLVWVKV